MAENEATKPELEQKQEMGSPGTEEKAPNRELDHSPIHGLWALTRRDLRKWYTNPYQLIISLVQPVVWLGIFGKALNFGAVISGAGVSGSDANAVLLKVFGTTSYFSFLACGMLATMMIGNAAFSGMSVVWDKRFGFMTKALSTPVGRGTIVIGKVMQAVIRSLIQAGIILTVAVALGMVTTDFSVLTVAGAFVALFLMSFAFSSLFVTLALKSSNWQTQMAVINLLNLPLMFASNSILPVSIMPDWLQVVVKFNPISYANDATRQLLLGSPGLNSLAFDFGVLGVFAAVLAGVGIVMSWRLLSE